MQKTPVKEILIYRKSPIRNPKMWRYFFRRVNVSLPGMQKKYRYFPKPKFADIIKRANFLNANGFYKHQKAEDETDK